MDNVAARISQTLKDSGLTPRNLAAIAKVHYTTIYLILKKGESAKPLPTIKDSLDRAIAAVDSLVAEKKLPLPANLSQAAKQDKLLQLVNEI